MNAMDCHWNESVITIEHCSSALIAVILHNAKADPFFLGILD